jgi:hypothetical protein
MVTLIFTLLGQAFGRTGTQDQTRPDDYHAELSAPGPRGP